MSDEERDETRVLRGEMARLDASMSVVFGRFLRRHVPTGPNPDAGRRNMVDLMRRARDRRDYGGAVDE